MNNLDSINMITTDELMIIAFPVVIIFGILLWLSAFSTTYKNSPNLDKRNRRLTSIFNATFISLIVTDIAYLVVMLILKNVK